MGSGASITILALSESGDEVQFRNSSGLCFGRSQWSVSRMVSQVHNTTSLLSGTAPEVARPGGTQAMNSYQVFVLEVARVSTCTP